MNTRKYKVHTGWAILSKKKKKLLMASVYPLKTNATRDAKWLGFEEYLIVKAKLVIEYEY